jgi:ribosomal protein S18 acetylase RimI-like enzyme
MEPSAFDIGDFSQRTARANDARVVALWFPSHEDATRWGGPDIPNPLTAAWLESEVADGSYFVGVDRKSEVVAIYSLKRIDEDAIHLRRFAIAPFLRGRGAGKAMITEIAGLARTKGARWLSLWVYGSNKAAIHLYKNAGFREIGTRAAAEDSSGLCVRMRLDL